MSKTKETEEGISVDCTECSDNIFFDLPASAEVKSVVVHPQTQDHDVDESEIERSRENQKTCTAGHTVSVLYDW